MAFVRSGRPRTKTMHHLPTTRVSGLATIRLATILLLVSTATAADPDPDALPRPRAKPAPRIPTLPEAPAAKPPSPTGIDPTNRAEVPKPEGRPGRAPDPAGSGKADEAAPKDPKADGKKKESPPPDGRCDLCGSCDCVRKVCVPKMTEKEIKKVCWDAKCEDFCVPGRSVWCGKACKTDDCGCWTHDLWKPTCGEVRTRVVPVRKETKRKVPAVEWKVQEQCACCRRKPCEVAAKPAAEGTAGGGEKGGPNERK